MFSFVSYYFSGLYCTLLTKDLFAKPDFCVDILCVTTPQPALEY